MYKYNLITGTICTVLIVSLLCISLLPSVAMTALTEKLSNNLVETLSRIEK